MRSIFLASTTALSLTVALAACSQQGVMTGGTGGTTGSGGTSTGSGGTSATGGSPGTGGSSTGTGGQSTTGTGGDVLTGTGGSSTGGSTGASGGSTGSSGGSTGSGGAGGGSRGTGGTTGSGGAAGSSGATGGAAGGGVSVKDIAGVPNQYGETLMSSLILMPCYQQSQQDCFTTPGGNCPSTNGVPFESQGLVQTESFTLGGTAGVKYNMSFTVNGVVEAKYYTGGTRDAGTGVVADAQGTAGTDTFYRGGSPVAVEHYNIYKLIVRNPDKSELAHYYLNSFPQTSTAYENHQTFLIHYSKTIPVPGGGSVDLYVSDSNCHAVDNCGPGVYAGTCNASRMMPSEPNFTLPATYMGKTVSDLNVVTHADSTKPWHSQIIHITVTGVAPM